MSTWQEYYTVVTDLEQYDTDSDPMNPMDAAVESLVRKLNNPSLEGQINLFFELFRVAIKDKDMEYLHSPLFQLDCVALGLDSDVLLEAIDKNLCSGKGVKYRTLKKASRAHTKLGRKLTLKQVEEIKASNLSLTELANNYSVTYSTIYDVKTSRSWKYT
jgi:hypothetical protein